MKRLFLLPTLAIAFAVAAPVASAEQPTREPDPVPQFTISGACSFDVLVTPLQDQLFLTTFTDASGEVVKILGTGVVKVRLTNVSTGESIDVNISGPEQVRIDDDGTVTRVLVGPWLQASRRQHYLLLTHGRYVPGSGIQNLKGTSTDLCALLAGS